MLNGSNNSGTGGVVFGSGGPSETTVATVDSGGNAHFNGTLQVSGVSTFTGSTTVKNNADAEIDSILSAGATANQRESFIYKDYTGASQWYLVKDTSNNWALNSAIGGLDSLKAYQSTGSGDTYINSANSTGHIRLNYETGSGAETDIYSGSSAALVAAFLGTSAIKFPGLAAASGHNCMQIDNSGYITNTGAACGSGGGSGTVNSGASGQIAYYSASGTALSGMSTIPVSSGGTGAATPAAAIAALGGASTATTAAQTFAGPLNVPSLNSSVNGLINVASPGFGLASNTCSGDDTAAFTAAQAAAEAFAVANVRAATIVVPPGCYDVSSSFKWQLVSIWGLSGPASSNAYGTGGVIIKQTTPGADVLATQDPSLGTSTYTQSSWSLKHLTLVVNDSAQGTHPHRWPGRWCDDVATTSGSAVIKTTSCQITPGDAGQAILLTGAGASGANLVTTIQSVTPGWASAGSPWQVITLAAAPAATLTNVHTYIATGNQAAATNIGPCGIAFDNYDGKSADWPTGYKSNASSYSSIEDVSITGASAASGGQNNSCGIFAQGAAINYALHASQFNINRLVYGVVQTTSELNPASASSNGDYQTWKDGQFNNTFEPWLSVNGEVAALDTIETNGTPIGFQILGAGNTTGDANSNWRVSNISGGGSPFTTLGWHVTGGNGQYTDVEFGNNAFLDTVGATYLQPQMYNATVDGSLNGADGRGQITGTVANGGMGNSGFNVLGTNSFSLPNAKRFAAVPFKGSNDLAGRVTADFIADGNPTAPHYNRDDLMLWPIDFMVNSYGSPIWNTYFTADSTALTGGTWNFVTGGATVSQWQQFAGPGGTSGQLVVGTNLPQQTIDVAVSGKCDSGTTTFTFNVGAYTGTTLALTGTCSTAFATYTGKLNLVSGDAGKYILLSGGAASNFRVQWVDLQPQTNADTASALAGPSTLPTNTLAHTNSPCDSTNAVATDAYVSACGGTTTATAWVSGVSGGSVAGLGTANTTRLYSFTLNTAINISKISYRIATADNTTATYDMGIYSYSGTLLCDLGATAGTTFAPSASAFTLPFSAVGGGNCALSAGNYLFGWTGTATTAILKGVNNSWMAQSNANAAAGNTTTAGALNSTITPAADNWADSNQFPEIALHN